MASIQKQGEKFLVYYDYKDEKGKRKFKTPSFDTKEEAEIFKREIEAEKLKGSMITPKNITVRQFSEKFVKEYGPLNWSFSSRKNNTSAFDLHINPILGDKQLQKVTTDDIQTFKGKLLLKRCSGPKSYNKSEDEVPLLSKKSRENIEDLASTMFDYAVFLKLLRESPMPRKLREVKRKGNSKKGGKEKRIKPNCVIWTKDVLTEALNDMGEVNGGLLRLSVHTAFCCTTRIGETLGITWDAVNFDEGYIIFDQQIQRVYKEDMAELSDDEIIAVFPDKNKTSKSSVVLMSVKEDASNRTVFMIDTLKAELLARKAEVEKQKAFFGDKYNDYGLVFALPNGDPVEAGLVEKWFKKWKENYPQYPDIVFHKLRHSSATYKLEKSGGDIKSVQVDGGWATPDMLLNNYSHSQDSRRKQLAKKMEKDLYPEAVAPAPEESSSSEIAAYLIKNAESLAANPEIRNMILNSQLTK